MAGKFKPEETWIYEIGMWYLVKNQQIWCLKGK